MLTLKKYLRANIAALTPYSSARSECEVSNSRLFLDANESPWSGNRQTGGEDNNRYPEPQPKDVLDQLAKLYGVGVSQLLLTRGIDEGLDTLFRSFCEPGVDNVIIHPPSYGYYQVCADIQACEVKKAPLRPDFSLDVDAILKLVDTKTKIVILCNPNNPTGNALEADAIRRLAHALEGRSLLLIDEAYIEFFEAQSFVAELHHYPHVLVMRTFSKAWGLAGVRLGVTIAHPFLIEAMRKVLAPYPISRPAIKILQSALQASERRVMQERVLCLNALREGLARGLKRIPGVVTIYPSVTNFLLVKVDEPSRWMEDLWELGIRIRDRSREIPGCVRISVGSEEENQRLLDNLRKLRS